MKKIFLFFILLFISYHISAQKAEFYDDIQAFKTKDSIDTPILFLGSSSITIWQDVNDYFPGKKIINRGFGASRIEHQIYYLQEVTLDYKPNKIFFYCGENDVSAGASAEIVADRFKTWFQLTRKYLPNVEIIYISMKPSPIREDIYPIMADGNNRIKTFLSNYSNTSYIDVASLMFNPDGTINMDLFLDDRLHMNKKGYAIWQKAIAQFMN